MSEREKDADKTGLPYRKPTRLRGFDYGADGAYFVTICTKDKRKTLSSVGDGALDVPQICLKRAGRIAEKYIRSASRMPGIYVNAYVIMPNHIHILLTVGAAADADETPYNGTSRAPSPTSSAKRETERGRANNAVSRFVSVFKRLCNKEAGENLFQRSFYDHIVRNEAEYTQIWNYIATNPERWEKDSFFVPDCKSDQQEDRL